MPEEFCTGDEHWWHNEINNYCARGLGTPKQAHKALIERHNDVVKEKDTVWHIGDLSMLGPSRAVHIERMFEKLNGIHHLVLGNHDDLKPFTYIRMGFVSVHTSMWFDREGYTLVLAHDPSIYTIIQNMGPKTYQLCGHIHNLFQHLLPEKRIINVGVDVWDYAPVSMETIINLIKEYE